MNSVHDQHGGKYDLYLEDDYHPSQTGSLLAAMVIAQPISGHARSLQRLYIHPTKV